MACEGGWKTAEKGGIGNGKERESEFVLGDDEEEEDEEVSQIDEIGTKERMEEGSDEPSPPDYSSATKEASENELNNPASPSPPPSTSSSLHHHLLLPSDTLLGLSLRYGLDPHHLCTLNNLPFSTIHTTPHLLHTRRYLLLLPSPPPPLPASVQTQLAHERALARFAMVTKETDPLVRGAYVGLAEEGHFDREEEEEGGYEGGEKKSGAGVGAAGAGRETTEGRAVGRFFEDAEWERENGGGGRLRGFPVASPSGSGSSWRSAGSSNQSDRGGGGGSWWSGWGSKLGGGGGGKEEKREVKVG